MFSSLKMLPVYKRDPFFLIIGAQKAGTTALFSYLSQHPMIAPAERKEIHFFSNDGLYEKGLQYYRYNFPKVKNKITFEVSPSYLMSPSAPKRIFDYNKHIRLIVILRDPVLRAYSAWNMYRERYRENRNWFYDDWLKNVNGNPEEFERRDEKTLYDFEGFVMEEIEYRSRKEKKIEAPVLPQGFYARYLKRYFSLFSREQILVLENAELLNKTVDVLKGWKIF